MGYNDFQFILFLVALLSSVILLIACSRKGKFMKGLFMALLPILIYFFINFIIEAILFGTWLYNYGSTLSDIAFHTANKNLSLCDLKIILSLITLIGWFYVHSKNANGLWEMRKEKADLCQRNVP